MRSNQHGSGRSAATVRKRRKVIAADQKKRIRDCLDAALDKKAEDIVVLDLRGVSGVADFFIICQGGSQRQTEAISDGIETAFRKDGAKRYSVEGRGTGNWILMDFGEIVVHIFHHAVRTFYALEKLWSDAARLDPKEILAWG